MTDRLIQYHSDKFYSKIESDVSMLSEKDKEIISVAMNKEWTNPKFKLRYFVGQMQITPFAKFRQWLLEIKGKEEAIENMEYEIAKWENEIAKLQRDMDHCSDPLDKRTYEIEIWNTTRNLTTSKRRLHDWYLERQILVDLTNEFLESNESKLPDGRSYMEILNTEAEDTLEAEYWTNRLSKQAACDMLFYGRINSGNMDAILSLPPTQQAEILALTINYSTELQKYQLDLQQKADQRLGMSVPANDLVSPSNEKLTSSKTENQELLNVYSI
jgi:hypothetical protein